MYLFEEHRNNGIPDDKIIFPRQLNWETLHLRKAGRENVERKGAILFYLPAQIKTMSLDEKTGFPNPYARDTRGEIARYGYAELKHNLNYPVVVGYEDNFVGIDVITRQFLTYKPDFVFQKSLQATCEEAVKRTLS